MTNEIITENNNLRKFKNKEKQNKDIDLYSEDWEYNEEFWKTYNSVNESPLHPDIKKSLERDHSLTEQFKTKNE